MVRITQQLLFAAAVLMQLASLGQAEARKTELECGSHKITLFKRVHVCPVEVDGRAIAVIGISKKEIGTLSGRHRISLQADTQLEFLVGPFVITTQVVANFTRGKTYEAAARIEGRRVFVWLKEKATGKKASTVATFKFKECGPVGITCTRWNILQD